ncbi:MAG: PAS domain S-box protein [Desulfohalobiaceae bacterium]|nr:PAS domain S-box protein [Desulfohalobiaceae bacterium]
MILPFFPIILVDVVGSILMIVLSFCCLGYVRKLRVQDQDNLVWTYLFWFCLGLACFAVSRSAGHILKTALIFSGHQEVWGWVRPFSGAVNTVMFIVVGAVTLFFERIWNIYQMILKDRKALQTAHNELLFLNENLEQMVQDRTRALAISEFKHRQIFEASKDMILIAAKDGLILHLNPSGYDLLGLEEKELKQQNFQDFLVREQPWSDLVAQLDKNGFVSSQEYTLRTAEGGHKRVLISASPAMGEAEGEDGILLLVKDIERRRLMEEQMAQADKLASIGELSSGVAHEINNPLGVILGYAQLLLRNESQESPLYHDLKVIEKQTKNCKTVVEDLLSFARTSKAYKEEVDIHKTIREVLDFLQPHFKSDEIEISTHFDDGLPRVLLDEKKIKQVLMNLVMNARHAMDDSGRIRVSTRLDRTRKMAVIEIADTGHGIEKQHLPRIFDPFFTTKPTGKGTGLGLSVSYGIIQNHEGRILVDSEPGQGSRFTIELPVKAED